MISGTTRRGSRRVGDPVDARGRVRHGRSPALNRGANRMSKILEETPAGGKSGRAGRAFGRAGVDSLAFQRRDLLSQGFDFGKNFRPIALAFRGERHLGGVVLLPIRFVLALHGVDHDADEQVEHGK